jgi:hypothetical protein
MDGRSPLTRTRQLAVVLRSIGLPHLRPCELKVTRLHSDLASPKSVSDEEEISRLNASILIDGKNCNPHLLEHLESNVQLPNIYFYPQFRMADINGPNIGVGLQDEQGLMLWMLSRINHDRLMPVLDLCLLCDSPSDKNARKFFVEEWKYELNGD